VFGFGCSSSESNHASSYGPTLVSPAPTCSLELGFTFTHATLDLLTAGAMASWFSLSMRLLKSSVWYHKDHTAQLIGHAISEHVRTTVDWPVADTQRIYLSAEIRGRIAIPVVLVTVPLAPAGVARGWPAGVRGSGQLWCWPCVRCALIDRLVQVRFRRG